MSITEMVPSVRGCGGVARIGALADELASLVAGLDFAALEGTEAAGLTQALARIERLAMAAKTLAAGRVAQSGWCRAGGFGTVARWLAELTKVGPGEAARSLETASLVGDAELGATRAALVSGALTATQAHEIATAAAKAPGEQQRLLALAQGETTAQLRQACRKVRLAHRPPEEPEASRRRVVEEMAFGHRDLGDGMGELFARMPTSWLVLVLAALGQQCDDVFARARAQGRSDPHQAYMVEALVTLLLLGDISSGSDDDDAYDQLLAAVGGGPPPPPPPPARGRARRRGRCRCGGRVVPRAKIIVRVDQAALMRGWAEGEELCDIAGVGPVPLSAVRELWPDAVVKAVLTRGLDVANVTHLSRRASEAMATAMQFTNPTCTNIACDNHRFVELDHRLGYANVGRTRLDELDGLCRHCHRLKTNENYQLVAGAGRRRFVPPEHPDHPGLPPTPRRRTEIG